MRVDTAHSKESDLTFDLHLFFLPIHRFLRLLPSLVINVPIILPIHRTLAITPPINVCKAFLADVARALSVFHEPKARCPAVAAARCCVCDSRAILSVQSGLGAYIADLSEG